MTRRSIVVAVAALTLISGLLVVYTPIGERVLPPGRFMYGTAATGPDTAALLTRRNDDGPSRYWVEHVAASGGLVWSVELTPLAPQENLGRTAVVADDDRVYAAGRDASAAVVRTLDRATGEPRWQTRLPGTSYDFETRGPLMLIDGPRLYVAHTIADADENQFVALGLVDGALLWSYTASRFSEMRMAGPGRLLVHADHTGALLDGETGERRSTLEMQSIGCKVPGALVVRNYDQTIMLPDSGEPPRTLANLPNYDVDAICGVRGDDLVSSVYDGQNNRRLVRRDPRSAETRWSLDLGERYAHAVYSVDGRLPRMLPLVDNGGIVVVDLDTGKQVREGVFDGTAQVAVSAERAWIWGQYAGLLLALDPDTGDLAAATALPEAIGEGISQDDLRDGLLWIHGREHAAPGALAWAAFDMTTGAPRHANGGIVGPDPTAQVRTRLGW